MPKTSDTPRYLILGKIMRPHGVRGELNVQIMTDFPERLKSLDKVHLAASADAPEKLKSYTVEGARPQREATWLIRLAGIEDREMADTLRNLFMFVAIDDAVPLEDDEVYLFQVMGLQVQTVQGEVLGRVVDLIETGANDVYVVRGEARGEVLIPAISGVIVTIDPAAGHMIIDPPPGLLD